MVSDLTVLLLTCCLPLLCLVIAGAGLAYWLISRKKAKDDVIEATVVEIPVAEEKIEEKASSFRAGSIGEAYIQNLDKTYDENKALEMGFTRAELSSFSQAEIMSVIKGRLSIEELRGKKKVVVKKSIASESKPSYTEAKMNNLVRGLWASEDPNERDPRDAMRFAGSYRGSCARKLREVGKDAIPYLVPYAERKEVAPLLEELRNL